MKTFISEKQRRDIKTSLTEIRGDAFRIENTLITNDENLLYELEQIKIRIDMERYEQLIKSISVGVEDAPRIQMTKTDAYNLMLDLKSRMKGATEFKNLTFETPNYFIYIGGFPCVHVAIDNKSGTVRKFTLYSVDDFEEQRGRIIFV
jgi:hypothetical protein